MMDSSCPLLSRLSGSASAVNAPPLKAAGGRRLPEVAWTGQRVFLWPRQWAATSNTHWTVMHVKQSVLLCRFIIQHGKHSTGGIKQAKHTFDCREFQVFDRQREDFNPKLQKEWEWCYFRQIINTVVKWCTLSAEGKHTCTECRMV